MKVWIWYRYQNRTESYYHQDEEQLGFYKKVHRVWENHRYQNTEHEQKKDVLVILHRKKQMSFNVFDKDCTQENVQLHLRHGESWLGGIVIEQVNYK